MMRFKQSQFDGSASRASRVGCAGGVKSGLRVAMNARGAMLLEVVLALGLFVMTSVFVLDAMSSSTRAVQRTRLMSDAGDLAISVMSEIEIGTIAMINAGPTDFELVGYEGWTWEVTFNGLQGRIDLPQLLECEVIVRHEDEGIVHRLAQTLWDYPDRGLGEEVDEDALGGLDPNALLGGGGLP